MSLSYGPIQSFFVFRHDDQVHVIRHQAIGPHLHLPFSTPVAVADPNTGAPLTAISIDGIPVSGLILGVSIGENAARQDDFVLDNLYSGDIGGVILTMFADIDPMSVSAVPAPAVPVP
jgi:hypothetical protein